MTFLSCGIDAYYFKKSFVFQLHGCLLFCLDWTKVVFSKFHWVIYLFWLSYLSFLLIKADDLSVSASVLQSFIFGASSVGMCIVSYADFDNRHRFAFMLLDCIQSIVFDLYYGVNHISTVVAIVKSVDR